MTKVEVKDEHRPDVRIRDLKPGQFAVMCCNPHMGEIVMCIDPQRHRRLLVLATGDCYPFCDMQLDSHVELIPPGKQIIITIE